MRMLRIKSRSMHEALAEARNQLGDNAVVLHTRQIEGPCLIGLGKKQFVEILAAADTQPVSTAGCSARQPASPDLNKVIEQIAGIKDAINRLASGKSEPEPSPVAEKLIRNGVSEKQAEIIASSCGDPSDSDHIIKCIARMISVSGPVKLDNRQARVALVGPTGVGKTTTAAKLAAQYTHIHKRKVALLTLDTYRIAAVEQLATYARILNAPLEVALCPEDVGPLIRKHADKDLILIDTVGRSQRSRDDILDLNRFVKAADPTEVHLVVSASSSSAVQKEALQSFSALSSDRIILSKLDECPQSGCILELALNSLLPYSYVTFGQEVPDDISYADKDRLARLVWEGMP